MMLSQTLTRAALLLALIALPAWIMAGDDSDAQHPANEQESASGDLVLRSIMRELDENMQKVVGAISREDWSQVAEIAPRIADHPEPPPAEKTRILRFVGTDAPRFRGYDRQVHEAAAEMGDKARQADGQAVIEAFSRVQSHCLACHQAFKEGFRAHFYGE